jgi:hypothetical protein
VRYTIVNEGTTAAFARPIFGEHRGSGRVYECPDNDYAAPDAHAARSRNIALAERRAKETKGYRECPMCGGSWPCLSSH